MTTVCQGSSSAQWNWQVPARTKDLLIHARAENRNIIITGPANCAKTFKPKPPKLIPNDRIFENPANDKCALIRSGKKIVFSYWSKDLIHWHNILLLLEEETVELPAPKSIYNEDTVISTEWLYLEQARVQSCAKALTMQLMTGRQRWSLTYCFAISFLHKSKKVCLSAQDVLKN